MHKILLRLELWLRKINYRFWPGDDPPHLSKTYIIEVPVKCRNSVQKMMDRTEIRRFDSLVSHAFTCFDILTEHIEEDGKIILVSKDGEETIFFPISCPDQTDSE